MKLSLSVLAVLALSVTACDKKEAGGAKAGGPATAEAPAAKVELVTMDATSALAKAGREATTKVILQAPKGAAATESYGSVTVKEGAGFQLDISAEGADIASRKGEIAANDVNKLEKFHVESADTLVYESKVMGKNEFHFLANVKVGEETFSCEDSKGPTYTRAQVDTMLAACKSITAK